MDNQGNPAKSFNDIGLKTVILELLKNGKHYTVEGHPSNFVTNAVDIGNHRIYYYYSRGNDDCYVLCGVDEMVNLDSFRHMKNGLKIGYPNDTDQGKKCIARLLKILEELGKPIIFTDRPDIRALM